MRWVMFAVLLCVAPAAADPTSPRIAALTAKTEDAFWKQLAVEGTPIVEDVKDPKGKLLVTFVYRAKAGEKAVAAYGTPSPTFIGHVQLERVAGTNTFAASMLVDPAARFSYMLSPGDDFGTPTMKDLPKRFPLFRPDVFNKRPSGIQGSILELPKAPPQPWLVPKPGTKPGDLVVHEVKSKLLDNKREVVVYTPPGFTRTGPKYPLVVMFDGMTNVGNLALPIVLDELIAAKQIPPVVVMMVGNAEKMRGVELPGNDKFADFVALELVPWVRASYNATNDRARTVVSGISFGGIAAAWAALRHSEVYGNVLSQSGSYWWAPDDVDEPELHSREYATRPKLPLRWWMEVGTLEGGAPRPDTSQLGANRHMRDVLRAKGYDVTYKEYVGAHDYINWRGSIADGLIALLAKAPKLGPVAAPAKTKLAGFEIDKGKPSLAQVVLRDSVAGLAKMKTANSPEQEVNDVAYTLVNLGRAKEALPLLQWNVDRFPKSQNVYDSLGEAYYHLGERAKAAAEYKKSLAMDPKSELGENAKKMVELLR